MWLLLFKKYEAIVIIGVTRIFSGNALFFPQKVYELFCALTPYPYKLRPNFFRALWGARAPSAHPGNAYDNIETPFCRNSQLCVRYFVRFLYL